MKRILLIAALLLPLLAPAAFGGNISNNQISTFISECQRYEGVEVVQLGSLATMALKATLKLATVDDPQAREALKLITGIKRISVLSYESCAPAVQAKISRRLDHGRSPCCVQTFLGDFRLLVELVVRGILVPKGFVGRT